MDPDRSDELIPGLDGGSDRWEDAFVDVRRTRCTACSTEYDSAEGLVIVAGALSGDTRRMFIDRPECAEILHLPAVAKIMRESDANGLGPATVDADGRTLPAWRIAEVREGRTWPSDRQPWRDEDGAPSVEFYAVDLVRDAPTTLDVATRDEVGVATDGELREFLDETEEHDLKFGAL
jgi:hypothetical protein